MAVITQTDNGKNRKRINSKMKDTIELDSNTTMMMKEYKRSEKEENQLGKAEAARFDEGKNRLDLMPSWPLDQIAQVYTYGTVKYDDNNWWKGMPWKKIIGPLLRHIYKWLRGEKYDDESGLHHLAHAAWQCLALMEYERNGIGKDDRVPYTLDLMDEEQRRHRILIWRNLADKNKLQDYNGLDADLMIQTYIGKTCSGECAQCSASKIEK